MINYHGINEPDVFIHYKANAEVHSGNVMKYNPQINPVYAREYEHLLFVP